MRPLLTLCLLLSVLASAPAGAVRIYQWKDAQGVTHYSENPPTGRQYQVREVGDRGGASAPQAESAPVAESAQCTAARKNLQILSGDGPVRQMGADGKPSGEPLDAGQRAAQKALAEAAVKAYCPPAP